jgi:hypothetical protein
MSKLSDLRQEETRKSFERFLASPQGQLLVRIVTAVITVFIDHHIKW